MVALKKLFIPTLFAMLVCSAGVLYAQEPTAPIMVVHNADQFYIVNPASINTIPEVITAPLAIAKPEVTKLHKRNRTCIKIVAKPTQPKPETTKRVVTHTHIQAPFGNYPSSSNSFYALHNGVATTPTVKTSPLTPLQRRGEQTLCVEFDFLEIKKSICFYTNTQILQSKYIGQITTRPPPIIS